MLPALRCLGNVITGDDKQTQLAIDAGIVPELGKLLASPKDSIRKEAAWALSNITAGTNVQIQIVIAEGLMNKLVELAIQDMFEVRRECIWAISNATSGASGDQLQALIEMRSLEALCSILNTSEPRTLAIALEGIENLLKRSKQLLGEVCSSQCDDRAIGDSGQDAGEDRTVRRTHLHRKAAGSFEHAHIQEGHRNHRGVLRHRGRGRRSRIRRINIDF